MNPRMYVIHEQFPYVNKPALRPLAAGYSKRWKLFRLVLKVTKSGIDIRIFPESYITQSFKFRTI